MRDPEFSLCHSGAIIYLAFEKELIIIPFVRAPIAQMLSGTWYIASIHVYKVNHALISIRAFEWEIKSRYKLAQDTHGGLSKNKSLYDSIYHALICASNPVSVTVAGYNGTRSTTSHKIRLPVSCSIPQRVGFDSSNLFSIYIQQIQGVGNQRDGEGLQSITGIWIIKKSR